MAETPNNAWVRDLDLTTLRLLVSVCDHGNIARAAELAHIAPSAISKRIAALEAQLGLPLLLRARRGVAPTAACQALLERARTMLFEMSRIDSEIAAFGGGLKGVVRVLATPSAIAESLLDDVAAFMREPANRNIKVDIEERFTRDVLRVLREGSAAIGICWHSSELKGLQHLPYRNDNLALAVHAEHPLASRKAVRFSDTLDHDHVGLPPTSAVQMTLQRAAARAGRAVNYRVVVSNFDAAFRVVAANLAISVIPLQVASPHVASGRVTVVPLTDAWAKRHFAICYGNFEALQTAGQRMVAHLHANAERSA
jgi:DNA-binding transcriptional LysR family regulator